MNESAPYAPVKIRWSAVTVVIVIVAILATFNESPFRFVSIALAIVAAPLSFPYVANRVTRVVEPQAREILSCTTWFALWSLGCLLLAQSSPTWILYGLFWASMGGLMMLVRTPIEPPLDDATPSEVRKHILRMSFRQNVLHALGRPS